MLLFFLSSCCLFSFRRCFLFGFFCCCYCCLQAELVSTCFVLLLQCCVQYERTSTKLNPSACRFSQYLLLSNYLYSFFFSKDKKNEERENNTMCFQVSWAPSSKIQEKNRQARSTLFFPAFTFLSHFLLSSCLCYSLFSYVSRLAKPACVCFSCLTAT